MKKYILILLAFISINLNAQSTKDVKETVTTITKTAPQIAKSIQKGTEQVVEQTPGVLSQIGTAVKDGTNTVITGAKDATNFVDTSSNFRWMLNKTNDFVVSAAHSLKVGAEKVLYIMAKKYFLMGIYAWISVVSAFIGILFIYKKFGKMGVDDMPIPIFAWIAIVGLIYVIHTQLPDAINYTFNPEYYVLQELKDFVINIVK